MASIMDNGPSWIKPGTGHGKPGYSRLLNFATHASIGYGLFLGVTEPPKQPRNIKEAQEAARPETFARRFATDAIIGLGDDAIALPIVGLSGHLLGKKFPAYKGRIHNVTDLLVKGILGIGTGMVAAVGGHDFMNFMNARQIVRAQGGAANMPDYRVGKIEGFQQSGAGQYVRQAMTGISSPSMQSVYEQVAYNPYANFLSTFIREGDKSKAGESPYSNPVRAGIGAAAGAGAATLALTGRYGFGKSTLFSLSAGVGAGLWAVDATGAKAADKNQGYAAVAETVLPTLGLFGVLSGLRATRHLGGRLGFLGAGGRALHSGINRAAIAIGRTGSEWGPGLLAKSNLAAASMAGRVDSTIVGGLTSSFWADSMAKLGTAGTRLTVSSQQGSILKWFGGEKMGRAMIRMGESRVVEGQVQNVGLTGAVRSAELGAVNVAKAGGWAANWGSKQVFSMLEHSGGLEPSHGHHGSTVWEQNLALAHLAAIGPHWLHSTQGMVSGSYSSYGGDSRAQTKRRRHATSSMASNRPS